MTVARHRARRVRGIHRRPRHWRGLRVVRDATEARIKAKVAELWGHCKGCKRCDEHGLCSVADRIAAQLTALDGSLDWEHAIAA
jgi:hypothetical protein